MELRYSPDQPRDDHGRFGEGSDTTLYHGTTAAIGEKIFNEGIKPPTIQTLKGDYKPLAYMANSKESARQWGQSLNESGDVAVVHVDASKVQGIGKDNFSDIHAAPSVEPEHITKVEFYKPGTSEPYKTLTRSKKLEDKRSELVYHSDIANPADAPKADVSTLYIGRHGATEEDELHQFCGQTDSPLTDVGFENAKHLAVITSNYQFDAVFCSDLTRARETARICAGNREVTPMYALRTWGIGSDLSGKEKTPMLENLKQFYIRNPNVVPTGDGAESINQAQARQNAGLWSILCQTPVGHANLAIAHSSMFKLLGKTFNAPNFRVGPGGLIRIEVAPNGIVALEVLFVGRIALDAPDIQAETQPALRYSPDQPRDDHGRFGEGSHDPKELKATIKAWQATGKAVQAKRQEAFDKAAAASKAGDGSNPIVGGIRNETVGATSSYNGIESTYVYRGFLAGEDHEVFSWKAGDSVQVMPSSWSTDSEVANYFAENADWHEKGGQQVVLQIGHRSESGDGPIHGIEVGSRGVAAHRDLHEVITGGRFKVTKVEQLGSKRVISLKQEGVF